MPPDDEILRYIQQIPAFAHFTEGEKAEVCRLKNLILSYRKGRTIVRQGDLDFSLFIIMRGDVSLTKTENPNLKITILKQGAIFGEVSFIRPRPRATNAVAETEVIAMKLNGEMLEKISTSVQGKIKDKIIQILIKRLDDINNAMITYSRR